MRLHRILLLLIVVLLQPLIQVPHALASDSRFFPETGHSVSGRFLQYWNEQGGLSLFGYPISDPVPEQNPDTGKTYLVQYFERNRFEAHPENLPPYDVLLGRLGVTSLERRGIDWHVFPRASGASSGCQYFGETGHSLCQPFLSYWNDQGGLPIFGLPLSEPHSEVSPTDGHTYVVQYFERNRFEAHPENQPPYTILLGLLGSEVYRHTVVPIPDSTIQRVVDLVNQERARAGVGPVHISTTLVDAAQRYSDVEARQGGINHTGPDGSDPGQRLDRVGYLWQTYGENLAAGYATADEVMTGWMNSSGHRANILKGNFHEIGIGLTHRNDDPSRYFDYWVMELATPR